MNEGEKEKLLSLAKAIEKSLVFFGSSLMPIDRAHLSLDSIKSAGIFPNECEGFLYVLKKMEIISDYNPKPMRNSMGEYMEPITRDFVIEVDVKKLKSLIKELTPDDEEISLIKPILLDENGMGYLKLNRKGKKIPIGKIKTRKFRLLKILIDPVGTARTVDSVFEEIKLPRDEKDGRLNDSYLSHKRKLEIIQNTLKELQKREGLKGRVRIEYINNKRSALLVLTP